MATNSEASHEQNLTNLESLINSIIVFGESYNPSRESIKLPALKTLLASGKASITQLNTVMSAYSIAVDACEVAFKPLGKLITRVDNALKSSETTQQIDDSAQTIIRKLHGKRAGVKITEEDKKLLEAEGKEVTQNSVSQMGYSSQLDNFDKLISFLTSVLEYNPNEEDLKISALKSYSNELKSKNTDVQIAYVLLENARNDRNEILYKPLVGLVDIAFDTKKYIKSIYGATSFQFKQVSKLKFISRK